VVAATGAASRAAGWPQRANPGYSPQIKERALDFVKFDKIKVTNVKHWSDVN
jgi:hypothetical protein